MKTNTTYNSKNNFEWLINIIRNKPWIILLISIYLVTLFIVLSNPYSFSLNNLDAKYSQLGLSLMAIILLGLISITSYRSGFKNSWSIIFIIYAITFLGLSLEALNLPISNMDNLVYFFLWRFPMVLFIAGLWINLATFYTDNSYLQYIPALMITLLGGLWFVVSLTISENIVLAMNGFLFSMFIPMMGIAALVWYKFSKETVYSSSASIALGFLLIGLVYSQWTLWDPTSLGSLYSISFTVINLSLLLIFKGFKAISVKNGR